MAAERRLRLSEKLNYGMTFYHVSHIARGAELTENFEQRTDIISFRLAFATRGSIAAHFCGHGRP
jgi:Na+/melibiose symporter-like transporter